MTLLTEALSLLSLSSPQPQQNTDPAIYRIVTTHSPSLVVQCIPLTQYGEFRMAYYQTQLDGFQSLVELVSFYIEIQGGRVSSLYPVQYNRQSSQWTIPSLRQAAIEATDLLSPHLPIQTDNVSLAANLVFLNSNNQLVERHPFQFIVHCEAKFKIWTSGNFQFLNGHCPNQLRQFIDRCLRVNGGRVLLVYFGTGTSCQTTIDRTMQLNGGLDGSVVISHDDAVHIVGDGTELGLTAIVSGSMVLGLSDRFVFTDTEKRK